MDMSSLFPPDSGMGGVLNLRQAPHVTFKAGVMTRDETTNMVTPDERKGVFELVTSPEDNLLHLQWRARNASTIDHDLILFPAETEMKLVTSAPAAARVYVLKWNDADKRMFFWMQGKDPTKDESLITQVNHILQNGPDQQQAPRASPPPDTARDSPTPVPPTLVLPGPDRVPDPGFIAPIQPDTGGAASGIFPPITLDQMRAALPSRTGPNPAALAEAQRELVLTTPSLVDMLNPDGLRGALADEGLQQALPDLLNLLPEQDRSVDRVAEVLRSPPLRAQAAALTQALQSGQAAEILRSFELPAPAAPSGYGLKEFLDALVELEKNTKEERGE